MKVYSVNVHYDMVITTTIRANSEDEARKVAERMEPEMFSAECYGIESCIADEWDENYEIVGVLGEKEN